MVQPSDRILYLLQVVGCCVGRPVLEHATVERGDLVFLVHGARRGAFFVASFIPTRLLNSHILIRCPYFYFRTWSIAS